jgi:transcription initiation factor IIF auxiliary subunit
VTIRLANTARLSERHAGPLQYYDWSVFVVAPDEVLDQVEFVTYFLHPTFPNPVRNVSDRASNFALNASGWGTFEVGALVHLRDGTTAIISHELDFSRS